MVTFSGAVQVGGASDIATTTALTLSFSVDPSSLTASDITVTGATKGALTGSGTTRILAISDITVANGATVSVTVASPSGFAITGSPQSAIVYKARIVVTFAGTAGSPGSANGLGTEASFNNPRGVAVDSAGNVYVADKKNHLIRKLTPAGVVSTLAGSGSPGQANGTGTAASFDSPYGVAVDGSGNVYVADYGNYVIRKITAAGVVTTLAGSMGVSGSTNGTGTAASFYNPHDVAVDGSGNVYVADAGGHRIRKITSAGVVTTLAGSSMPGSANGTGTAAEFCGVYSVAVDGSGNVYAADYNNHLIRKITSAGVVTTFAGTGASGYFDATGTEAKFSYPAGIEIDSLGNLYVADYGNNRIRKITPEGAVTTLAGSGGYGYDDGTGNSASFHSPYSVAVDGSGNVYIADHGNHLIRKIQ